MGLCASEAKMATKQKRIIFPKANVGNFEKFKVCGPFKIQIPLISLKGIMYFSTYNNT